MLPDPYPPTSGLRYSFPQLLGVLISDKINQLYHPPKPGPLLTQGHPHCLSTVCVQCLIDVAVEKPGLLPQFWTIPKNRPCTQLPVTVSTSPSARRGFPLSSTGIYARSSPQ